jgi:hypothetical protein
MFRTVITCLLMTLLVTSCATQHGTTHNSPQLIQDSSCTLFSPIRTYGKDWQVIDIRTVKEINVHNDTWNKVCATKKEN